MTTPSPTRQVVPRPTRELVRRHTVLVQQALHGLSDREAAEAVTFDLRWKAACGFAVTAFHATTLTYWRRRLASSIAPNRIFDAVGEVVAETGVLAGRTRRALDANAGSCSRP